MSRTKGKAVIKVISSHGSVLVDANGKLLGTLPVYGHINRFDIDEYKAWAKSIGLKDDWGELVEIDILLIGFWWSSDGEEKYSEPELSARNYVLSNMGELRGEAVN